PAMVEIWGKNATCLIDRNAKRVKANVPGVGRFEAGAPARDAVVLPVSDKKAAVGAECERHRLSKSPEIRSAMADLFDQLTGRGEDKDSIAPGIGRVQVAAGVHCKAIQAIDTQRLQVEDRLRLTAGVEAEDARRATVDHVVAVIRDGHACWL